MYVNITKTHVIAGAVVLALMFGGGFFAGYRYGAPKSDSNVSGTISELKDENSQLRSELKSAANKVQSATEKLQSASDGLTDAQSTVGTLSDTIDGSKDIIDGSKQLIDQSRNDIQSAGSILDEIAKSNGITETQTEGN